MSTLFQVIAGIATAAVLVISAGLFVVSLEVATAVFEADAYTYLARGIGTVGMATSLLVIVFTVWAVFTSGKR